MGVRPTSPHVFCGLGEGIRPCPSWHSVGGGGALGVWGPRRSVNLVRIAFHLCYLQIMLSCWLHRAWTFSVHGTVCSQVWRGRDENQHLQVRGHGARPEKGGLPTLGWRRVLALSSILGSCSRVREGWNVRLTDGSVQWQQQCIQCTVCCGERSWAQRWSSDLPVNLRSTLTHEHPKAHDQNKTRISDTSGRNELPSQGGREHP